MTDQGLAVFTTAIGHCGIAWGDRGVVGVCLPGRSAESTRAAVRKQCPEAVETEPPQHIAHAMDEIVALLRGERLDLTDIELDLEGMPEFHRKVYEVARAIPPGKTLTYGEVAARIGMPGSAQAVGQALGHNPIPIIVPCHRVLAAGGKMGGFSAPGGVDTKRRILVIEGARPDEPTLF
ncbi:methylated-DNA--[protein]-cysteine S-methyltransferase [Amycolatopsis sp.]|uniref:methylated-DNA--[protein]-cysteine S-methyltransferase n=1 Tax=Amycolatopsis sp. TaxID=37632 RepID=UPI002C6B1C67|nr:methylated-DNA--[protein]-cysteine S-methyltransferase [Amycolatopsis sp.]HVV10813.1 methylated-DNA--[protein]-cysteine S-methyltransferase [Amycolatopsis sp.]